MSISYHSPPNELNFLHALSEFFKILSLDVSYEQAGTALQEYIKVKIRLNGMYFVE